MDDSSKDEGLFQVLMERFQEQRLPRLLDIKESVDQGNTLSELDLEFLEQVARDTQENQRWMDAHPELHDLYVRAVALYADITEKALENEKRSE